MTKISFCAALAAVVVCGVLVSVAPSQQNNTGYPYRPNNTQPVQRQPQVAPQRQVIPVGLLDVAKILKQSSRLKAEQQALTEEMKRADAELVREQEAIRKLQKELRDYQPGSQDYKQRESEVARRGSDLQVRAKLKRKEYTERRAKLLYNAYKEIEQEAQAIASRHGFVMVLKYDGGDVPSDHLEAVFAYASKPVVWFNQGLDITNEVLASLERRSGYNGNAKMSSRTGGHPGVPPQPRR